MIGSSNQRPPAADPSREALRLESVTRRFRDRTAVDGVDLTVAEGELFALLGPSGSGKSTLLRLVAGFEPVDSGRILLAGREVSGPDGWVEPEHRGVGLVPQGETLFPHLSVGQNVEFGIRGDRDRAVEVLDLVGLADRFDSRTDELSGGERQRVALARALAPRPKLVLLDEPFSALDAALRRRLRREVVEILRTAGAAAVLVTHDQEEALALADRVAVLRDGRITQCATPADLYARPCDQWTARFVGEVNIVSGDIADGRASTVLGDVAVGSGSDTGIDAAVSGRCNLALRPEQLTIRPSLDGPARLVAVEFRGHHAIGEVHHPSLGELVVRVPSTVEPGAMVIVETTPGTVAAALVD